MRFLAALPLLLCLTLTAPGAVAVPQAGPSRDAGSVTTTRSSRPDLVEGLHVLHGWDARRARAWTTGDVAALRSLYVDGSGAGRADVRLLRAYQSRRLLVRRLVTQIFAVRVLLRDPSRITLSVFDRVAGGEMVRDGHALGLRSTPPVTRVVELRRASNRWRVVEVSGSGRALRAARR